MLHLSINGQYSKRFSGGEGNGLLGFAKSQIVTRLNPEVLLFQLVKLDFKYAMVWLFLLCPYHIPNVKSLRLVDMVCMPSSLLVIILLSF